MKKTLLAATLILSTVLSANASEVIQASHTPEPVNKVLLVSPLEESLSESRKQLQKDIALTLAQLQFESVKVPKTKKYKVVFVEAD